MHWIIVIGIVALLFYVLTRKNSVHPTVKSTPSGHGNRDMPHIPKGFQIFEEQLSVAGTEYRHDDALHFANGIEQTLVLEREPNSAYDENAIRVIGVAHGMRLFIGYVPREIAAHIVGSGLMEVILPRLVRIWCTNDGFIEINFQIIGPEDKIMQYRQYQSGDTR